MSKLTKSKCVACGSSFQKKVDSQKYCSKPCAKKGSMFYRNFSNFMKFWIRLTRWGKKNCQDCGVIFQPTGANSIRCASCKKERKRIGDRERYLRYRQNKGIDHLRALANKRTLKYRNPEYPNYENGLAKRRILKWEKKGFIPELIEIKELQYQINKEIKNQKGQ